MSVDYLSTHLPRCYAEQAQVRLPAEKTLKSKLAATNHYRFRGTTEDDFIEHLIENKSEEVKEMFRQYARAQVISEAELQAAPTDMDGINEAFDNMEDPDARMLTKGALLYIVTFNKPLQILIKLLLGLHSANIRTNKGSIYRIRFVAPGKSGTAPDPAMKSAAKADTAPKASPTSAIYPLLAIPTLEFTGETTNLRVVTNKLDAEFDKLVEAEFDALEDLTVSGSSSATESTMNYIVPVAGKMYTNQYMPKHMMFNYARSQKET